MGKKADSEYKVIFASTGILDEAIIVAMIAQISIGSSNAISPQSIILLFFAIVYFTIAAARSTINEIINDCSNAGGISTPDIVYCV